MRKRFLKTKQAPWERHYLNVIPAEFFSLFAKVPVKVRLGGAAEKEALLNPSTML